mmetsp:Transcript_52466/g.161529  ORF Transcript_52466/g.161529 Transcript_52466/m.161529 type:complete len:215 (-) Transcript_52466:1704-2348(-)
MTESSRSMRTLSRASSASTRYAYSAARRSLGRMRIASESAPPVAASASSRASSHSVRHRRRSTPIARKHCAFVTGRPCHERHTEAPAAGDSGGTLAVDVAAVGDAAEPSAATSGRPAKYAVHVSSSVTISGSCSWWTRHATQKSSSDSADSGGPRAAASAGCCAWFKKSFTAASSTCVPGTRWHTAASIAARSPPPPLAVVEGGRNTGGRSPGT